MNEINQIGQNPPPFSCSQTTGICYMVGRTESRWHANLVVASERFVFFATLLVLGEARPRDTPLVEESDAVHSEAAIAKIDVSGAK